ncbi:MAG: 3'-5' exonuclease [Oscillospiraceae bacterium]|nr:3'-5' exonuclease [Oscillospiraceae bacterium]
MKRYIAFDVETPNHLNDRMSAIGITVIEEGEIVNEYYTLVNPDTYFDAFNVELTGITPESVISVPNFPALWAEIEPIMDSGVLIAHNAPFDMSVLAKCLRAYDIEWKSCAPYACTCQMGRRLLHNLPNHRLNTISDYLGIELDHHNAGSDSRACAEILRYYMRLGVSISKFERIYDLRYGRTLSGSYR